MDRCAPAMRIAALVLAMIASPASAQWVWRDASRQTHASDRPPPADVPEKDILQRPPALGRSAPMQQPASDAAAASVADAASASAASRTDPALEARRQAAQQEKRASEAAERDRVAAAKADNCDRARSYLQTIESGTRLAHTDANGERVFLDDAARAQEAQRARDIMGRDCR